MWFFFFYLVFISSNNNGLGEIFCIFSILLFYRYHLKYGTKMKNRTRYYHNALLVLWILVLILAKHLHSYFSHPLSYTLLMYLYLFTYMHIFYFRVCTLNICYVHIRHELAETTLKNPARCVVYMPFIVLVATDMN